VTVLPPSPRRGGGGGEVGAVLLLDYAGDDRGLSSLVRALAVADIPVVHFAEQASDLEDIFMQVTRGVTQ